MGLDDEFWNETERTPWGNFTRRQMRDAFNEVANKENWKYPVNTEISEDSEERRNLLSAAIVHFTGSVPKFTRLRGGRAHVWADGYYQVIGP